MTYFLLWKNRQILEKVPTRNPEKPNKKDKAGKEKDGRLYRVVVGSDREGKKRVLVVWRDMTSLDASVERPFLEAQAKEVGSFDEQWINGDSAAKNFASLDGLFRRLMEEGAR